MSQLSAPQISSRNMNANIFLLTNRLVHHKWQCYHTLISFLKLGSAKTMKRTILSILIFIMLTGCLSKEGRKFIEDPDTQRDVKELVEETLKKEAVPVKADSNDAIYEPLAKGAKNEERIRVRYKTVQQPQFYSYAFVEVDTNSKPRKLINVSESGLIQKYDYDLYNVTMKQAFHRAYKTSFTSMKNIGEKIPNLFYEHGAEPIEEWNEPHVNLALDKDQLTENRIQSLFSDFEANKFASPNENEAKALLDSYLFIEDDPDHMNYSAIQQSVLPTINLRYTYEGTFNNELMNEVLDEFQAIDNMPNGLFTITVLADNFTEDDAVKKYNKNRDGGYSNTYRAHLRIDEE